MAKTTLSETAARKILTLIAEQNLSVGDKLPTEQELMALLGVGRNTVREALRSLVSRNIVTVRQGSGCFVSDKQGVSDDPLGLAMLDDPRRLTENLMQIRAIIEPEIAALAAQNATPAEVSALEDACARVEADIEARRPFAESDRAFHAALAACTHNTVISRLVPIISEGVTTYSATVDRQEFDQTLHSHRAILAAVQARAAWDARTAMQFHLLYNQERFRHSSADTF